MNKMILEEHKVIKACPQDATCFGCRNDAVEGVGTRAYLTDDGHVVGLITTKECHQGFPGIIHGGIVSTYFDEVLWHLYEFVNPDKIYMTLSTEINYHIPIPPGIKIRVVGHIDEINGRKFIAVGRILLPDDRLAAECRFLFLSIRLSALDNLTEKETNRDRKSHEKTDVESIRF